MSKFSDTVREMFRKGDEQRDVGLTIPEDILVIQDIAYGEHKKWQILDMYIPKDSKNRMPVIISVHGGGWVYGLKENYQFYCMSLAQQGFAVVNFNYRLAPDYKYPIPLEDTNLVVQWIMNHAEEYGLDSDNIFAVGDSAGAQILGAYSAICTNANYAKEYSFEIPKHFSFKAIALNCGIYHLEQDGENNSFIHMLAAEYLPDMGNGKEWKKLCVDTYITSAFPPTFFMTATGDYLDMQTSYLQKRLMECKVPFVFRFYGDENSELGHVFQCNIKMKEAQKCNLEECNFFKEYISKKDC